jgi:predicted TIM-barrel fold metal-dependent hydrolase
VTTPFPIVDAHVHVWSPEYIPSGLRMSWAEAAVLRKGKPASSADEVYPRVSQDIVDPDAVHLRSAMDLAGIDRSVILGVDYGPEDWARPQVPSSAVMVRYDELCRQSEGRLSYAAGLDPRRAGAATRAREYLASDVCRGIKFYPPAGFRANDSVCDPVYQALVEAEKTAVFHTAAVRGRLMWSNAWPIHIADVQARFPDLRIVLAHAGYSAWWDECVALAASHPRTYLELSLWDREAAGDSQAFVAMLERAMRIAGSDRIIFASDTMYGEQLKGVDALTAWVQFFLDLPEISNGRISMRTVEDILRRNAEEAFFGARSEYVTGAPAPAGPAQGAHA